MVRVSLDSTWIVPINDHYLWTLQFQTFSFATYTIIIIIACLSLQEKVIYLCSRNKQIIGCNKKITTEKRRKCLALSLFAILVAIEFDRQKSDVQDPHDVCRATRWRAFTTSHGTHSHVSGHVKEAKTTTTELGTV